jgi:glycosyltransferase involved in cell wall biosynthesis
MKHVLLYTDMAGIYGAEQCTHALALGMRRAGHRVTVVQPHADHHLIAEREANGIAHHWLAPDNLWDYRHPARALTDRTEPEQVLTATAPDLVVFSDGAPVSSLTAKEVAGDRGIPYLALCHCVTPTWAAAYAAQLPRLPSVYARAAEVVAVSQENLDELHGLFGLPPTKGVVIHNGRPEAFFAPRSDPTRRRLREELGIPRDGVVCLTVGRMELVKGYQYQIAAFKHLRASPVWPSLHFVWVGTGTLEHHWQALVRRLQADDRVRFLARRADVPALLDAADMFVLPSQFEGMPLVVLEAMAKRLPVIATAVSGTPEALGDAGCLLPDPRKDSALPERLAATISGLALDAARRRVLGQAAHDRAQAQFREAPMVARYLRLVERMSAAAR